MSSASRVLRRRIERRRRLVEQPDRPRHRDQPGDRQPPPLSGRQISGRQVGERRQGRPRPAPARRRCRAAEKLGPELQVFADRQRRLQRVLVAEVVRLLADRARPGRRRRAPAARGDAHQPGDHAQQGGFAGAVAAGDHQRLARRQAEIKPGEHLAPATVAGQVFGRELHQAAPACRRPGRPRRSENLEFPRIFGNDPG